MFRERVRELRIPCSSIDGRSVVISIQVIWKEIMNMSIFCREDADGMLRSIHDSHSRKSAVNACSEGVVCKAEEAGIAMTAELAGLTRRAESKLPLWGRVPKAPDPFSASPGIPRTRRLFRS